MTILTTMDKLQLTGQNLGWGFNFRSGHVHALYICCFEVKLHSLKLKERLKQRWFSPDRYRRGARKLLGDNLNPVWAEFSTIS